MNPRYRITRNPEGDSTGRLTLEECTAFFSEQPDFLYTKTYTVQSGGTTMTVEGDFFMWQVAGGQVPFRLYEGDLYVAVSHEVIYQKMLEIAEALGAQYVQG